MGRNDQFVGMVRYGNAIISVILQVSILMILIQITDSISINLTTYLFVLVGLAITFTVAYPIRKQYRTVFMLIVILLMIIIVTLSFTYFPIPQLIGTQFILLTMAVGLILAIDNILLKG